jgi:hypothetical protein
MSLDGKTFRFCESQEEAIFSRINFLNGFQLLRETEHDRRWCKKKVVKIVHRGLPRYDEGRWN